MRHDFIVLLTCGVGLEYHELETDKSSSEEEGNSKKKRKQKKPAKRDVDPEYEPSLKAVSMDLFVWYNSTYL